MANVRPIQVNLVEDPEWKKYDPIEQLENYLPAMDETMSAQLKERYRCEVLLDDISGVGKRSKKGWSPGGWGAFSEEEAERVCDALRAGDARLETLRMFIQDAHQWMWETAIMPDDVDIKEAVRNARDETLSDYKIDEEFWEEFKDVEADVLMIILSAIRYEHEHGFYDRYIKFVPEKVEALKERLLAYFQWAGSDRDAVEGLNEEVKDIMDFFMAVFWKELDHSMGLVDINHRLNWNQAWKARLEDKDALRDVKKEIREFLKEGAA